MTGSEQESVTQATVVSCRVTLFERMLVDVLFPTGIPLRNRPLLVPVNRRQKISITSVNSCTPPPIVKHEGESGIDRIGNTTTATVHLRMGQITNSKE